MLVLERLEGQRIRINDDIVIELVEVRKKRGAARIGITAPNGVRVHREEIYEAIKRQEASGENANGS